MTTLVIKVSVVKVDAKSMPGQMDAEYNRRLAERVNSLAEPYGHGHPFIPRIKALREILGGWITLRDAKMWVESAFENKGKGDVC